MLDFSLSSLAASTKDLENRLSPIKYLDSTLKDITHPNLPLYESIDVKDNNLILSFKMDDGFISLDDSIA